ncbi:hypothetical protein TNCV_560691 [Trichonephila clavipes]|nr:hypothetical protein TNCV_560691 [Trichonephila clavipes]
MVRKFGKGVPARVSSSSLDRSSSPITLGLFYNSCSHVESMMHIKSVLFQSPHAGVVWKFGKLCAWLGVVLVDQDAIEDENCRVAEVVRNYDQKSSNRPDSGAARNSLRSGRFLLVVLR